ncbi:MAG: adenine phosphoribosyltransferase [Planctomycetia bacterium]|nr:adenine phosphoribosyltransferase [Planctomycetia bacterium]
MDLKSYVTNIPDYPKPGIIFRDITTLISSPEAFKEACRQLIEATRDLKPDMIAAPEARGFLFAAPLALELQCGLVPIRKPNKLPRKVLSQTYDLEYGSDTLTMHEDAVQPGQRVLVLDDLLATGGTVLACRKLLEQAGAQVVGYGFVIELSSECKGRELLEKDGDAKVFSLIDY